MKANLTALTDAVERLTARVAALEDLEGGKGPEVSEAPTPGDETVSITGALTLADGPVHWEEHQDAATLLDSDWSEHAASLAALSHPVRLELLRNILDGTHRTAELAGMEHLGTSGQLHHHLRQLLATGWVRQAGRGSYEVPTARVVPLLACIVGARR